jgi:hypothetical protein
MLCVSGILVDLPMLRCFQEQPSETVSRAHTICRAGEAPCPARAARLRPRPGAGRQPAPPSPSPSRSKAAAPSPRRGPGCRLGLHGG